MLMIAGSELLFDCLWLTSLRAPAFLALLRQQLFQSEHPEGD